MLKDKKHVFWQAFLITVLVFSLGLILGVYLEQLRSDRVSISFYDSEVSLYDSLVLSDLLKSSELSSQELIDANLNFADKIYYESRQLEFLDDSNKITDATKSIHRKYDLLRTILWINFIELKKQDNSINTVVYLYIYDSEDIDVKAKQVVFSRALSELKAKKGSDLVLIPIAVDTDISSLDYLISYYNIDEFPVIFINEEHKLTEVSDLDDIESYLN